LQLVVLGQDARLQERLHQCQDAFISDSGPHPTQQGGMRNFVEARFDITLHNPLIRAARVIVDLGNGVLSAAFGAEAIRAWLEVRLENWLEHQLEGGLDHPVPHCGNT
jgi:hypothetical protein